ncbi:MAG: monofunctional biosynthetic peptidoglycan transglycosylase [Deltaproteobacteria bacterium]|nr:monofunctional biosynthetic peptidoglycan transglycosylase [Deltaproteobacteria bacterium]
MASKSKPASKKAASPKAAAKVASPTKPRRWRWVAAGLFVMAAAVVVHAFATLPDADEIARLAKRPPHSTALIDARAREAEKEGHRFTKQQRWVPLGEVAPELVSCVIASEDARFFLHDGVDVAQMKQAVEKDLRTHRYARGASTLTQQLAKNLWLTENKSLLRKLQEAVLAERLEDALSKERILELYVNEAEWGEGIFGVEAASRAYFNREPRALTLAQSAMLAAMLPAPRRLSPRTDAAELLPRARHVLERVADEHLATPKALALAREELERTLAPGERRQASM